MNLQPRVQRILTQPGTEWPVIEAEQTDIAGLYKSYIAPLAAIGPVCALIGLTLFWGGAAFGLRVAVFQYIGMLIATFLAAVVFSELAPTFASRKNRIQALKLVAYSSTAMWVAGVLNLIPFLGILGLLGALYSLYTLYLGLPVMMKTPADRVVPYLAVGIIVAIVANVILFLFLSALGGVGMWGAY